jgi:uncharacterized protein (DUF1499 family)
VLTTVAIVISIAAACIVGMFLLSFTSSAPADLGVRDGRLAKCPDSPNCVSTQAEDRDHWIAPLTVQKNAENAIDLLDGIIRRLPRTQIIEKSPNYLRAEFRSAFFRFADDVEFYVETESGHIHFRSASRVGRSDLGVNRARMEQIRSLFQATQPASTSSAVPPAKSSDLQPVR